MALGTLRGVFGNWIISNIITLILLSGCGCVGSEAQTDSVAARVKRFACVVIDGHTFEPLCRTTVLVSTIDTCAFAGGSFYRYGVAADAAGRVEVAALPGDTIIFSHVGYGTLRMAVADTIGADNLLAARLLPDTVGLAEVVVRRRKFPPKSLFAHTPPSIDAANIMARNAFASGTRQALSKPRNLLTEWSSEDNQRYVHGKHLERMEYKGMVPPDQMVSFGSVPLAAIAALVKKVRGLSDTPHGKIVPMTEGELRYLLGEADATSLP